MIGILAGWISSEYALTSNYNLLVPAAATYGFNYFLTNSILHNLACAPGICYACAYDLRIQVIPSCGGTALLDLTIPLVKLSTTPAPQYWAISASATKT